MAGSLPPAARGRHTAWMVALLLLAVALVGLGAGFLIGFAGGDDPPNAASTTTTGSPVPTSPRPSASSPSPARATTRAASEVERGRTKDFGYLIGSQRGADGMHVTFDRAQLLVGDAATAYAKSHHLGRRSGGTLVVNENPRTRDLVLAPEVKVYGGPNLNGTTQLEPVPLDRLLAALPSRGGNLPLDLSYDRLGYVVDIREKILT